MGTVIPFPDLQPRNDLIQGSGYSAALDAAPLRPRDEKAFRHMRPGAVVSLRGRLFERACEEAWRERQAEREAMYARRTLSPPELHLVPP